MKPRALFCPIVSSMKNVILDPSAALIRRTGYFFWALLTSVWIAAVARYAHRFPRADEENFIEVVTGSNVDWWGFAWTPGNEHYSPLVRLYYLVAARLSDWNIPFLLYLQVALISLGLLFWLHKIRRISECPSWSEVACVFALLSPAAFETWLSACSYAPLFPVYLIAAAFCLEAKWTRSWGWLAFVAFLFLWTVGMGILVGGMLLLGFYLAMLLYAFVKRKQPNPLLLGVGAVAAIFLGVLFLTFLKTPQPGHHSGFRAHSLFDFLKSFYSNLQFGILGYAPKWASQILFPALLAGAMVSLWSARRYFTEKKIFLLLASIGPLALCAAISYGRALYATHVSRYFVMVSLFWMFLLLAIPAKSAFSRGFGFAVFLVSLWAAICGIEPLHHYGKEIRERDNAMVYQVLHHSPEEAAANSEQSWGQRPERMVELINALSQSRMGIFKP